MEGKTDDTLSNPSALVLVCDFRPGNHLTLVVSRCKILQSPLSLVTWDPKLEHRPRHSFKLPPVRNSSIALSLHQTIAWPTQAFDVKRVVLPFPHS